MICGLNALILDTVVDGVKQRYTRNHPTCNDNVEPLIDFCARNEFRINNTYFLFKEQHKVTFNNT